MTSDTIEEADCKLRTVRHIEADQTIVIAMLPAFEFENKAASDGTTNIPKPSRTKPRTEKEWQEYAESLRPSVARLRELGKAFPPPTDWFEGEDDQPW